MKAKLLTLFLLACALWAQAQGTLQFHATLTGSEVIPPNSDQTIGTGDFWLTGGVLSFRVDVPLITFITTGGTINGPALAGVNAPVIFDLGFFSYHPGSTLGDPPGYTFESSTFTLTGQQIAQLESGLWYVNIASGTHPSGQLRGQILQVPEPPILPLLCLGALGLCGWQRKPRKEVCSPG